MVFVLELLLSGHYLYVEYENGEMTGFHGATIRSPKFPPPPKYNAKKGQFYQSCKVRFFCSWI